MGSQIIGNTLNRCKYTNVLVSLASFFFFGVSVMSHYMFGFSRSMHCFLRCSPCQSRSISSAKEIYTHTHDQQISTNIYTDITQSIYTHQIWRFGWATWGNPNDVLTCSYMLLLEQDSLPGSDLPPMDFLLGAAPEVAGLSWPWRTESQIFFSISWYAGGGSPQCPYQGLRCRWRCSWNPRRSWKRRQSLARRRSWIVMHDCYPCIQNCPDVWKKDGMDMHDMAIRMIPTVSWYILFLYIILVAWLAMLCFCWHRSGCSVTQYPNTATLAESFSMLEMSHENSWNIMKYLCCRQAIPMTLASFPLSKSQTRLFPSGVPWQHVNVTTMPTLNGRLLGF